MKGQSAGLSKTTEPSVSQQKMQAPEIMRLTDGSSLFYRCIRPERPSKTAVIIFHRGHEHSARLLNVIEELALEESWVFAWDARGHGNSTTKLESYTQLVSDMDEFLRHIANKHNIAFENMLLVGHSFSCPALVKYIQKYNPKINSIVLVSPAFKINLFLPFAMQGLKLLSRINPEAQIRSYVSGKMLSRSKCEAKAYDQDRTISRNISVKVLLGLHETAAQVIRDAGKTKTPTLMLLSGSDFVADLKEQKRFFNLLASQKKQMRIYPGMRHDIFHEKGRSEPLEALKMFASEGFANAVSSLVCKGSKQSKESKESKGIKKMKSGNKNKIAKSFCYKKIYYGAFKILLQTLGRLSQGIRIGWKYGFDSGESLDYVYENKARGFGPLGKLIDRAYLNTPGWTGIRTRGMQLKEAISWAIKQSEDSGEKIELMDIASGPGRYVLDVLEKNESKKLHASLCDLDKKGLEFGRTRADKLGLANVDFIYRDAFATESTAEQNVDIAIASGLYELFPDNEQIAQSLTVLSQRVREGAYLIYTNQPWHPQLEFIARVLTNRNGEPWQMRCRSQEEIDELVKQAGFEKISMSSDELGIFTVSIASKRTTNVHVLDKISKEHCHSDKKQNEQKGAA